jgi:hypothetical protein
MEQIIEIQEDITPLQRPSYFDLEEIMPVKLKYTLIKE